MNRQEILEAYAHALHAAEAQGAPNPRACADRYVQGLELGTRRRSIPRGGKPMSIRCMRNALLLSLIL